MILSNFPAPGAEKINNAQVVDVLAADQIKIGDTVYTVKSSGLVYADRDMTTIDQFVRGARFSPDGKLLVLCGAFAGYAKLYSVSGNIISYLSDIYADAGTTALDGAAESARFSTDGTILILCGDFSGGAKVYDVDGITLTYVRDISANSSGTNLSYVKAAVFSPDGTTLVLAGIFTGSAKIYSVSGNSVAYVKDVYADSGTTALKGGAYTVDISPNGQLLVVAGSIQGYAKYYSLSGTNAVYVGDIYRNAGTTALDHIVETARFSPDGDILLLGGQFISNAKIYNVSGASITFSAYLSTSIGIVHDIEFSPDGNTVVCCGSTNARAVLLAKTETGFSFVTNLLSDFGTTALDDVAYCAAFSPAGNSLVMGGKFSGCALSYAMIKDGNHSVPFFGYDANLAENGVVPSENSGAGVGFSKSNMEVGASGKVKLIGSLDDYAIQVDTLLDTLNGEVI